MLRAMITVHHLETSRSQRVLWLLEELGLPYEIKLYKRHPVTKLAPLELKKIHPLGKSPVITDSGNTIAFATGGDPVDVSLDDSRARAMQLKKDTRLDLLPTISRLQLSHPLPEGRLHI